MVECDANWMCSTLFIGASFHFSDLILSGNWFKSQNVTQVCFTLLEFPKEMVTRIKVTYFPSYSLSYDLQLQLY